MHSNDKFNCFIIGQGTLLIRCAEILLSRSHDVCGIISSDESVKGWANQEGIPLYELADHLTPLKQKPFDYLFSIINEHVLSSEVLEAPRKWAINYHDSLLPAYGGVHATSWALMRKEAVHGITWHIMDNQVDAGDILKQEPIQIACDETASTLNAKCYEAAIYAFGELIDDLSSHCASAKKQSPDQRTYFPRHKRPPAGCVISWNDCADNISAFIRALDFGYYANPLGLAKLAIGNDFVIIPRIDVLDTLSGVSPGTITHIDHSLVRVSTASCEVALREVMTIEGESLSIPEFTSRFSLREGYHFDDIDPERASRITALNSLCCKHEAFWVKRLEMLQPITIPYAVRDVSPHNESLRCTSVYLHISAAVEAFLQDKCETLNSVDFFVAAYGAYFSRIAGRCSFEIGFADFDLRQELEGVEEFFESNPPMRFDLKYTQSLLDISFAVQQEVKRVRYHMTFARDVLARYPKLRSPSTRMRKQLLPVTVQCLKKLHDYQASSKGGLTLIIAEDSAEHIWAYDPDIFNEDGILRMMQQFTTFLQGFTAHPDWCIADLPLLKEEERYQVLVKWNNTQTDAPQDRCIHHLFEAQAERTPDTLAVIFEEERLTYQQLNCKANQLAHYLQKFGVGQGVLVALCVERSVEMVVGILGVMKAGGAYVPLDPSYPFERISSMLEDAKPPVLLTQERLIDELPAYQGQVVFLDSDWPAIAKQSEETSDGNVTGEDLAYVIYTSGSTGKPKGVMVPHRGVCNSSDVYARVINLPPGSRMLQLTSLGFDMSVFDIVPALISGMTLCLADQNPPLGAELLEVLQRQEIEAISFPPSMLATLPVIDLPKLRFIGVAGEAVAADLVARWAPSRRFYNAFGPAEGSIWVSGTFLDGSREPHIGRPIDNIKIYLLDSQWRPVPIGMPGELCIGGIGVTWGYLRQPDVTAEKYIPDPFSDSPGARLYRTGDLARYLPNGELDFLGRIDYQVKIRGFRIELGEVEAVLGRHPAVREAVVIAREDTLGDRRLVAYIVPEQEQAPKISELRSYMKKKLPDNMVPSAFVLMDALPLSANGKIDRRALPAPDVTRPELEEPFVAPRSHVEEVLAKIWADVLKLEQVGVHDHFFELGGHSLLGIYLLNRIREVWGKAFPLSILVQGTTIEQMAAMLQQEVTVPELSFVAIQPQGSQPPFFAGGSSSRYVDLARFLGLDQPFYRFDIYALQEQRLDRGDEPYTQVEAIAAHFIKEIRAVQPVGPYSLGGGCEGGVVAFEIARQLQEQSHEVAQLVIWETSPSGFYQRKPLYPLIRSAHLMGSLLRREPREVLAAILTRWKRSKVLRRPDGGARTSRHEQIQDSIFRALRKFVPQPYTGRITFFQAKEQRPGYWEAKEGWDDLATSGLEVYTIPGNHTTCFDKYFLDFAKQLKICLNSKAKDAQQSR